MRRPIVWILILLVLAGGAAFFIVPPIAQPQWYHNFADQRFLLGIPNFWNVISNLPFFLVGVWGVGYLVSEQSLQTIDGSIERWMYLFLFVGVALTGVGSAYYHLEPDNERLVWDRLPIAMTFMALFAIIMAERLNRRVGVWLFLPLVLVGAASVFYWHVTETLSRGDLRLYLMVQGYPAVAIPLILWLCPATHSGTGNLYGAIGWYASAKLYEFLDKDIYTFGQIVSGHTLKHIGAAVSCYMILIWIRQRRKL